MNWEIHQPVVFSCDGGTDALLCFMPSCHTMVTSSLSTTLGCLQQVATEELRALARNSVTTSLLFWKKGPFPHYQDKISGSLLDHPLSCFKRTMWFTLIQDCTTQNLIHSLALDWGLSGRGATLQSSGRPSKAGWVDFHCRARIACFIWPGNYRLSDKKETWSTNRAKLKINLFLFVQLQSLNLSILRLCQ